MLLALLAGAGRVIAAPDAGKQPVPAADSHLLTMAVLAAAAVALALIIRCRWYRLAAAPTRPKRFAPEVSLALAIAMLIAGPIAWQAARMVFGIDAALHRQTGAAEPLSLPLLAQQALAIYAGQAVIMLIYAVRRAPADGPDARIMRTHAVFIALAAIVLLWPITASAGWLAAVVAGWLGAPPPDVIAHDTLRLLADSPLDGWFIVMVVLVLLLVPTLEEVLYRGLLQEAMIRVGARRWPAIILTSILFAAMHWQNTAPHAVVALFVLSLGFGWVFERTGRLTAPIAMHVMFNLGNLSLALLVP